MTRLGRPSAAYAGDRGEPDPLVRAAIERASDRLGYARAVVALCASRLLLPIVATGDETAAVSVVSEAGERALLAFTGLDALKAWDTAARPVPCTLDDLSATVTEAGAIALLLDIAGPVPFQVEGGMLAALASGQRLIEFDDGSFGWVSAPQAGIEPGWASSD